MNKIIELKNATKEYKSGDRIIKAVDNVSLSISDSGKLITIAGPSGCGKTTFLNLIGTLDKPDKGKVLIEGVDVTKLDDKKFTELRKKKIGFIFQTYNLIPNLTALENVMLPMEFIGVNKKDAENKAMKLLEEVKMSHRANHFPTKLSGGEQQRVAIARALANNPDIVLADEPTGNLDTTTGKEIVGLLKKLAHGKKKTIIIVTHDERIVKIADVNYKIRDGRITK